MTLNHIGIVMVSIYDQGSVQEVVGSIFQSVGMLAFPTFVFMVGEGIRKTRNRWMYLLRVSILALSMLVAEVILIYGFHIEDKLGFAMPANPVTDIALIVLLLLALSYLKEEGLKKLFALLGLIPIAYGIICYVIGYREMNNGLIEISWLPAWARMSYGIFGLVLGVGYYFVYPLADLMSKSPASIEGVNIEVYRESEDYRRLTDLLAAVNLLLVILIMWGISYIGGISRPLDVYNASFLTYGLLALPLIFLYNGKRGYNGKVYRVFSYLYFPLHIVIIFLVFYFII